MARRRKSGIQGLLGAFTVREMLFHPAVLFVGLNVFLALTAIWAWGKYQHQIVRPAESSLSVERIQFDSPPAWIPGGKKEILDAVLAGREPEQVSIFETDLVPNAVDSLKSVGWIEKIQKVEKSRDGIHVDLAYRNPLALVELNYVDDWKGPRLIPVDRNSVVLPQKARSVAAPLPLISMYLPSGDPSRLLTWTQWPDERVHSATLIVEALKSDWQNLGLMRIVSWRYLDDPKTEVEPFQLWTKNGKNSARVVWGNAPGREVTGEASWQQKVMALREYVEKNGPFNQLGDRIIDVRSGKAVRSQRAATRPAADRSFLK